MDKQQLKLIKQSLKSSSKDKISYNKRVFIGSLIAIFIAITPFLFYLYEYVPATETWDTFLFTYKSGFYGDAQIGIWTILMKLIPLLLLFIWFFTCRHWWYHTLLVPISMFSYQIIGAFNEEMKYFDEFQLIYLVPIMAIIIPSIYLIRAKMFDKINTADKTMQELEDEFMIKPKGIINILKQYF